MTEHESGKAQLAKARLQEWFPKGSTVYTVLRHVSRSGMRREIGVLALSHVDLVDGRNVVRPVHPNAAVADLLGLKTNKAWSGVVIDGAGMDMGFEVAYRLGLALYGDGYALQHSWL